MKNFWDYVETNTWAQWAIDAVLVCTFFGIIETVYPMIHGGETFGAALTDWLKGY
jgi:hypothetical protein